MKRLVFIVGALLQINSSVAQINESDTARFQLLLATGGLYQSGNIELFRMTAKADLLVKLHENFVFKTQNDYLYQTIFKNKADQNLSSRNFLYFKPTNRFYPYVINFISTNFRREIDFRSFAGMGGTYQLLQKPLHNLKISGNLIYEATQYSIASYNESRFNGQDRLTSGWYSAYLSGYHNISKKALRLTYEVYWQQSVEVSSQYRYHYVVGLSSKILKQLSANIRVDYTYENVVSQGNKKNDMLWVWGLLYQFKSTK